MLETVKNIVSSDGTTQRMIAPVIDTLIATQAWAVGDYFIYAGELYKVTSAIAVGDSIVENTNCVKSDTVMELMGKDPLDTNDVIDTITRGTIVIKKCKNGVVTIAGTTTTVGGAFAKVKSSYIPSGFTYLPGVTMPATTGDFNKAIVYLDNNGNLILMINGTLSYGVYFNLVYTI